MMLCACQKDQTIAPAPDKVRIAITSPEAGASFRSGDTLRIAAHVSYAGPLHGYEIQLIDSADGGIIYDAARHVHSDSFDIRESWLATAAAPMTVRLRLITTIDHEGTVASSERSFRLLP